MRFGIAFNFMNYTDWDRFEALERGESVGPPSITDEEVWRENCACADLAEPLGFDTLWAFEQHAAPYIMIPDPTQFLAYYAGRSSRINFGSSITVLPWYNPFRLAEQIAMLQHNLGRDRQYFLGIGRGLARRNFDSMSVDMDSSRKRFNEVLDVLRLAFTEEIFSYAGEFFRYENVSLRPRPFDPGVILDAWAAWTSEASLRNMAERGLHPLTNPSKDLAGYRAELDLFDQVRAEHGHGPAKRPILQVHMFCCESEQEAQEKMEVWVGELVDAVLRMYELGTERFASGKGYEEYRTKGSDFGSGTKHDALERLTDKYMRESILGTPEQCIEKILHHYETVQPSELVTVATTGSQRGPEVEKSMRLFSEKVLPRVAHLREDSEVPVGVGG